MADDLRTRIAAALKAADKRVAGFISYEELADAVIRELTDPIRGCTDPWHWATGKPYQCPSCGYWMGEGFL